MTWGDFWYKKYQLGTKILWYFPRMESGKRASNDHVIMNHDQHRHQHHHGSPFPLHHPSLESFRAWIIHSNIQIIHNPSINHHHWFNPPIDSSFTQLNSIPTVFSTNQGHPPLPIAPYLPPSIHRGGSPPLSFPAVHQICPASHSSPTWLFSPPQKVHKIEGCRNPSPKLPSRELTYPTLGKGTSSSKGPWEGIC